MVKRGGRIRLAALAFVAVAVTAGGLGVAHLLKTAAVERTVRRLAPGLEDPSRERRVEAAARLTRLLHHWGAGPIRARREAILAALLDGLEGVDAAVRDRAAEALAAWGDEAAATLRQALRSPDDQVRIHGAYALSLVPLPVLIPELRDALHDHRVEVRVYALEAIGALPRGRVDEELVSDVIFRVWKDTDPWARNAAAEAMFNLGYWTGIPSLVRNLEGRFWPRFNAYERLARIYRKRGRTLPPFDADAHAARRAREAARVRAAAYADPELCRRLIANLAVYKNQIFTVTKWSLTELGKFAVPALTRALTHPNKFIRVHAAEILALLADPRTPGDLRREARDPLLTVARPALRGLLRTASPDVDQALHAMRALANLGQAGDVAVLLPHATGRDPDLAVAAIESIGGIGGEAARRALEGLRVTGEREDERRRALARMHD